MKLLFVLLMLSGTVMAQDQVKKEVSPEVGSKARELLEEKDPEDCEEKAQKPVIIPEEPVLGLGTAGCSLDDL